MLPSSPAQNDHPYVALFIHGGIGLPGVAASGTIAANTLVDPMVQLSLMAELKSIGALQ
jgi:hypothetical protein